MAVMSVTGGRVPPVPLPHGPARPSPPTPPFPAPPTPPPPPAPATLPSPVSPPRARDGAPAPRPPRFRRPVPRAAGRARRLPAGALRQRRPHPGLPRTRFAQGQAGARVVPGAVGPREGDPHGRGRHLSHIQHDKTHHVGGAADALRGGQGAARGSRGQVHPKLGRPRRLRVGHVPGLQDDAPRPQDAGHRPPPAHLGAHLRVPEPHARRRGLPQGRHTGDQPRGHVARAVRRGAGQVAARVLAGGSVELRRLDRRPGIPRRGDLGGAVRRVPPHPHLRAFRHGRHLLLGAAGKGAPTRAVLHPRPGGRVHPLGRPRQLAVPQGTGVLLGRRRAALHGGGLPPLLPHARQPRHPRRRPHTVAQDAQADGVEPPPRRGRPDGHVAQPLLGGDQRGDRVRAGVRGVRRPGQGRNAVVQGRILLGRHGVHGLLDRPRGGDGGGVHDAAGAEQQLPRQEGAQGGRVRRGGRLSRMGSGAGGPGCLRRATGGWRGDAAFLRMEGILQFEN